LTPDFTGLEPAVPTRISEYPLLFKESKYIEVTI
jgi:hypothetical protein